MEPTAPAKQPSALDCEALDIPDEVTTDLVQFDRFIQSLPLSAALLHGVAVTLRKRFESCHNIAVLDCAILAYDRAMDLTPPEEAAYIPRVCDAALAFLLPFEDPAFTGRRDRLVALASDIPKRIMTMNALVAMINDDGHPLAATIHQALANLYYGEFELSGNVDDLSHCISSFERAVSLFQPRGGKEHQEGVFLLSACLLQRFQLAGNIGNYDTTIKYRQELLDVLPVAEPDHRATALEQQALTFLRRAVATGSVEDMTSAIECQRQSLALTSRESDDYPRRLRDLSALMATRGRRTRSVVDVNDAIAYAQEAVDLTTIPLHRPERLSELASHLSLRASFTHDTADMSSAIDLQQQVIGSITSAHPQYVTILTSLGTSFIYRYLWTKGTADLSYAISAYEEALKYDSHNHAQALERLARHLTLRFQHCQEAVQSQADIDKAISNLEQSISLTPPGDPNFPSRWEGLAHALSLRFGLTANPNDINHSIYLAEKALSITPENDAQRAKRIFTLCNSLSNRFDSSSARLGGDRRDLNRAIALSRECLSVPNLQLSTEISMKTFLASFLARRYVLDAPHGQQDDIREAHRHFITIATDPTVDPTTRASNAALFLTTAQDAAEALQACALTISLHPEYASLDRTIEERYYLLESSKASLARNVASYALKYGETELAVEWLEQARCLVWTQLDGFRPPPPDLESTHPELAKELALVGSELRALGSRTRKVVDDGEGVLEVVMDSETIPLMKRHMELARAWDSVLARIREAEGFSSFLKPMKINQYLEKAPKEGPVVILTASLTRADAIALVAGKGFVHIPLHGVSTVRVEEMKREVWACLKSNGVRARDLKRGMRFEADEGALGLRDTLSELWVLVVEPILATLGYSAVEDADSRPRIWWCPTGSFGFLPIHAAGIYGENASLGSCVLDYVISSYTPNITTLLKKQTTPFVTRPNKLLLVSQPATPDLAPIPATKQEAEELESAMNAAGIPVQSFTDDQATVETIKQGLTESTWAHFACHASQDVKAPLQSGLHLHDGRLQLSSMMDHLPNAEHAFLSACQTSMGYENLKEEAVHIAAGMLAAGYRGVVGTMWSIADSYGPIVAKEFYSYLLAEASSSGGDIGARLDALNLEDGEADTETGLGKGTDLDVSAKQMDCGLSARALDVAIRKLRREIGDDEGGLLTWVPYVHFGV